MKHRIGAWLVRLGCLCILVSLVFLTHNIREEQQVEQATDTALTGVQQAIAGCRYPADFSLVFWAGCRLLVCPPAVWCAPVHSLDLPSHRIAMLFDFLSIPEQRPKTEHCNMSFHCFSYPNQPPSTNLPAAVRTSLCRFYRYFFAHLRRWHGSASMCADAALPCANLSQHPVSAD